MVDMLKDVEPPFVAIMIPLMIPLMLTPLLLLFLLVAYVRLFRKLFCSNVPIGFVCDSSGIEETI